MKYKEGDKVYIIETPNTSPPESPGYCDEMKLYIGKILTIGIQHDNKYWFKLIEDEYNYWWDPAWFRPIKVYLNTALNQGGNI